MARRARTIKPEILEDSKTATLSHLEYRLFTGSWLVADDYGNLRGDPGYLRGQIVWATDETVDSVARAISVLVDRGLLTSYVVRDQRYLHVSGWDKHQRIDRPSRAQIPGPGLTSFQNPELGLTNQHNNSESDHNSQTLQVPVMILARDSRESREGLAPEGEGEGDQDPDPPKSPLAGGRLDSKELSEFKAKVDSVTAPAVHVLQLVDSIAVSPVSKPARKRNRSRVDATSAELASVRVILDRLGAAADVDYRGCDAHVRLIVDRLRDGITEHELRAVVAYCAGEWESKPEMRRYLRPETLFGPSTVNRYLDAARTRFATELAELSKQRELA